MQRLELTGLLLKRSRIDRIRVLQVLIERRLEYRRGILGAVVNFKKSLDRGLRWVLL